MSTLKLGLDISLNSTALTVRNIEDNISFYISFLEEKEKYKKKYTLDFLNRLSDNNFIEFKFINQKFDIINDMIFEDKEYNKLIIFRENAKIIADTIYQHVKNYDNDYVLNIEHYSYNSENNNIIEIVAFSTFIKDELLDRNIKFNMKSPLTLKQECCRIVYGVDKKGIARRESDGLAGGRFKKPDMLTALYDMNTSDKLKKCVEMFKDDLYRTKEIPKPIDDIVDSYFLSFL